jgi:AcrR family transcriptional regulator
MSVEVVMAKPGRPRDHRLDEAIVAATIDLLGERGYNGLSLAGVAERAGTTTPAIYRRWSSKADLVLSTVFRTHGDDVVADTGDLDADIRSMVRWSLEKFGSPAGRAALAGLLGEPSRAGAGPSPELSLVWGRTGERLARAVERGEIRADIDTDGLILQLAGPAMMATAVHGSEAVSEEWVERIATVILDGVRAR